MVAGEPIRPPPCAFCPLGPAFHAWYSSQRLVVPGATETLLVVEAQRELEGRAVGTGLGLLVGVGAHELADDAMFGLVAYGPSGSKRFVNEL